MHIHADGARAQDTPRHRPNVQRLVGHLAQTLRPARVPQQAQDVRQGQDQEEGDPEGFQVRRQAGI